MFYNDNESLIEELQNLLTVKDRITLKEKEVIQRAIGVIEEQEKYFPGWDC